MARRRGAAVLAAVAPAAAAALSAAALAPRTADVAAQAYRADLVAREGLTVYDTAWYGGHHLPGYSLLSPPLTAWLGVWGLGALAVLAAAAAGAQALRCWRGDSAATVVAAAWFGLGLAAMLFTGRTTFLLGVAVAAAAAWAALAGRRSAALVLAALTGPASPVAALFLALGWTGWGLADPTARRPAAALVAATLLPPAALAVAFPEGGVEPFVASAFWPAFGAALLLAWAVRAHRAVALTAGLTALVLAAAFVADTALGGNATRLGVLLTGPVLAATWLPRHPRIVAVAAVPLAYWALYPPVRDVVRAQGDPAARAGYYDGVRAFLAGRRAAEGPSRIEVPFTAAHWEARELAETVPLARGWERQLDVQRNAIFYGEAFGPAAYRRWLDREAIAYVAVPDARLDRSAEREVEVVRELGARLPVVWRDAHWTVHAVPSPTPLGVTALGTDAFATRGDADTRIRFSPYWAVVAGRGCVERWGDDRTRVTRTRGPVRVAIRFAPGRVLDRGRRCSSPMSTRASAVRPSTPSLR